MQLLIDLVRSVRGVDTAQRARDAIRLGIQLDNHYQIWCHERFHADGTHCEIAEPFADMKHGAPALRTAREGHAWVSGNERRQALFLEPGAAEWRFCPLWHYVSPKWKMDFHNLVVTVGRNELLDRSFTAVTADVNWYVGVIGAGAGTVAITAAADAVTGTTTAFTSADVGSDMIIVGAGASAADLITTIDAFTSGTAISVANNASTTVSGAAYAVEPRPADTMSSKSFVDTDFYSNATRPAWTRNGAAASGAMSNSSSRAQFNVNATGRAFGAFLTNNNTVAGTTGVLYGGGLDTTNGSRSVVNGDTLNVQIDLSVTAS